MTEAIGPGSAVIAVSTERVPIGTVAYVLKVLEPNRCHVCKAINRGGYVLNIPHRETLRAWCSNHWAPYHGPEQARRIICEEIA